jgi:hypothetical protein
MFGNKSTYKGVQCWAIEGILDLELGGPVLIRLGGHVFYFLCFAFLITLICFGYFLLNFFLNLFMLLSLCFLSNCHQYLGWISSHWKLMPKCYLHHLSMSKFNILFCPLIVGLLQDLKTNLHVFPSIYGKCTPLVY